MSGLYLMFASPRMEITLRQAVGLGVSRFGIYLVVQRSVVIKVCSLDFHPAVFPRSELRISGHADRVGGVAWHPQATLSQSEEAVNLASGGGDKAVLLWSLNS